MGSNAETQQLEGRVVGLGVCTRLSAAAVALGLVKGCSSPSRLYLFL